METKPTCNIMHDLIPSYADGLTQEVTNQWIEEHLASCPDCRARLEAHLETQRRTEGEQQKAEIAYLRHLRRKQRRPILLFGVVLFAALILLYLYVPLGIGETKLTSEEYESLMEQIVAGRTLEYEELLPDQWFAAGKVYGVTRNGRNGTVYMHLSEGEYVVLNGRAYLMSGSSVETALEVAYDENGIHLLHVDEPSDGSDYLSSLRQLFPLRFYLRSRLYENQSGGTTVSREDQEIADRIARLYGASVDTENMLDLREDGSYEIWTEDPDAAEWSTIIVEEGSVTDKAKGM